MKGTAQGIQTSPQIHESRGYRFTWKASGPYHGLTSMNDELFWGMVASFLVGSYAVRPSQNVASSLTASGRQAFFWCLMLFRGLNIQCYEAQVIITIPNIKTQLLHTCGNWALENRNQDAWAGPACVGTPHLVPRASKSP